MKIKIKKNVLEEKKLHNDHETALKKVPEKKIEAPPVAQIAELDGKGLQDQDKKEEKVTKRKEAEIILKKKRTGILEVYC